MLDFTSSSDVEDIGGMGKPAFVVTPLEWLAARVA